jgi:hypothetical protein
MAKTYPTFLEVSPKSSPKKRQRFFSESLYNQSSFSLTEKFRFHAQNCLDGVVGAWHTFVVFVILIFMGCIQACLSLSEETISKSNSKILRIRRGKEQLYKCIPTRLISRLWGFIHSYRINYYMRTPFYRLYSAIYGVKIEGFPISIH